MRLAIIGLVLAVFSTSITTGGSPQATSTRRWRRDLITSGSVLPPRGRRDDSIFGYLALTRVSASCGHAASGLTLTEPNDAIDPRLIALGLARRRALLLPRVPPRPSLLYRSWSRPARRRFVASPSPAPAKWRDRRPPHPPPSRRRHRPPDRSSRDPALTKSAGCPRAGRETRPKPSATLARSPPRSPHTVGAVSMRARTA